MEWNGLDEIIKLGLTAVFAAHMPFHDVHMS